MGQDIEKCDGEADPDRCQTVTRTHGQCINKGAPLATGGYASFCRVHGGNNQQEVAKKKSLMNYRLTKFKAELQRHSSSSQIKSLREEIGILRIIIEEKINSCDDVSDLMMQSHQISDLVVKVEKIVTSCHKLEGSLGQTLDKQAILQFAGEVINVISAELEGEEDKINSIANKLMEIVGNVASAS